MAQASSCGGNDDTNLNGKYDPATSQETLSGQRYKQWQGVFSFMSFDGKPLIGTRGAAV